MLKLILNAYFKRAGLLIYTKINYFLALLFLCWLPIAKGQVDSGLVARYTFNNNGGKDELGENNAKIYGAVGIEDRFGNPGFAYYLKGLLDSYINLGTSEALKPKKGTIALWVNIWLPTYKGKGTEGNPIIITKAHAGNDFNEAYSIGYNFNLKHIGAANSFSDLQQVYVHPAKTTSLRKWHHAVMTYDDDFLCFYLDGALEGKVVKNFETAFLENDSVLVGICMDQKNQRSLLGSVDDISIYNRVLLPEEVLKLYKAPNPNSTVVLLNWICVLLGIIALILIAIWLIRRYIQKIVKREKEKNKLQNQWYEQENKILKAQMNPHFMFNSLNTIQQFIIVNDNEKAQLYLSKFSRLVRKSLESNTRDSISLKEEIEICEKYLEIESLRFNHVFSYSIVIEGKLDPVTTHIPHFLIQAFIENAIWHGLLPKEGDKQLMVTFELINEKTISCTIEDNGVGREKITTKISEKKQSLAINFIRQRLLLMSKIAGIYYGITITDKVNEQGNSEGTRVVVTMPIITS